MTANQFWILILGSLLLCALILKEIFLSRSLSRQQLVLLDVREVVSTGPGYEKAWQQLALPIYQASRQDPALAALLKNEHIAIHPNPAVGAGSPPATTPPGTPPSSKGPVPPLPPAAP